MTTMPPDLIDALAQLGTKDAVHATRHRRDKVVVATQGSHEALFDPALPGLSLEERLLVALQASLLSTAPALAEHYRALASRAGCNDAWLDAVERNATASIEDTRLREILRFCATLIERPVDGDKEALFRLPAAGLTAPAIVTLGQLIAYLSYQIRLVAGLAAMKASATAAAGGRPAGSSAAGSSASGASRVSSIDDTQAQRNAQLKSQVTTGEKSAIGPGGLIEIDGFTNASLEWSAWLDVVDPATATPEQLAVLQESHPKAMVSDYYRLLVHQPRILRERSAAFNAIMYAPGGLPRAERELASTVVSKINGCVYCASVHAQRFEQLAKRNDTIIQVFTEPRNAGTTERERAIVAFSIAMTAAPQKIGAADIDALKAAGLDETGILDLLHSVAIFAWANRLMLNLGEPVPADQSR